MTPDPPIDPLARAIVEGLQVDWQSAESSAPDDATRGLVRELAVIAAIAEIHSASTNPGEEPAGAAASAAPDVPAWGPFRLLERVGQGEYGEVYRAQDTRLDREVALKLLRVDAVNHTAPSAESTIREGSLLARIRHPNVVTIHGAERIGDRIGLWMEYIEGSTLEQLLEERISLSEPDVVHIGIQICRAVSAVHGAGLLHRDIKAQNVMRASDGRIVLMDFGAGRMRATAIASDLVGTPLYLAPEVLRGEPATVRSDIYSLGVLLYRLVAGAFPIDGRTVGELRQRHEDGERTPIRQVRPDISPQFARAVERALDPLPANRFESADAFEGDLAATASRSGVRRAAAVAGVLAAAVAVVSWGAVREVPGGSRSAPATTHDDLEARGHALLARRGLPSLQQAAELYERAIGRNPNSAVAHAGLALAYALMSFPEGGIPLETAFPIMQREAAAALRLDPRLAEAHAANGWVHAFERRWSEAEQAFDEAIRLEPGRIFTYTNYSISTLQSLRKFDDALRLLEVAAQHDPQSLDVQREIGEVLMFAGRFAEAVDTLQRVRAADPDFAFVQTYLARSLIFSGRVDEALTLWQPVAIWPAQAYVRIGRRKDAEALAVEHAARPHQTALIAAALGDTEAVVGALERAAASAPHRMGRLLNEPEIAAYRAHPRVVALRQAFNLP